MPAPPVAPNFSETFDVKVNFSSKLTLNFILTVNKLPETVGFFFSKVTHLGIRADIELSQNFPARGMADAMNIL
jgi:hypothetical protein